MNIKAILYIYYRLLDMHSRGEDNVTGAILAVITISLFFWLNIFSVVGLFRNVGFMTIFFNKTIWLSLMILLFIMNYFIFVHNKKYNRIIQMFKDEQKSIKRRHGLYTLLYLLISIVFFVLITLFKPCRI